MAVSTTRIFEYATRYKLRFASVKGALTVEDLWDVPLRSKDDFNLEAVAKAANRAFKEISEETFVPTETKRTPEHTRRETALEVVKFVIDTKIADEQTKERRAAAKKEKEELLAVLADKQKGELNDLTVKQLQARIRKLDESDDDDIET